LKGYHVWVYGLLACAALAPSACIKVDTVDRRQAGALSRDTPLQGQSSDLGILSVGAELREDGLILRVGAVPAGSTLECTLDLQPLTPCNDGGLYTRPSFGDHKIKVTARLANVVTAVGESVVFSVLPGVLGVLTSGAGPATMALVLDDPGFVNGGNWSLNRDFVVRFKLLTKAGCEGVQVKCKYDSLGSRFWTNCDANGTSYSVAKDQLALGLQYLTAQASCADKVGPPLRLFWYGVPEDYQALMLRDVSDANNRHTVDLIKQDDCPEGSQRRYECAVPAAASFSACVGNGNSIDRPVPGYRVRLNCGGVPGPALVIGT